MRGLHNKGEKFPFIIRTILVMLAVYLFLMLTATWCMKLDFESELDAHKIWEDLRSDLKSCRWAEVDSAAYRDGFNQAQALAVLRYHTYRLYQQYGKYDGLVDMQIYHCTLQDGRIASIEKLSPPTPVLVGAPYNRNSPILTFADAFDDAQVASIEQMARDGRIGTYIDHVEGYRNGRFFYPQVMTIYEGEDEKETSFRGAPKKQGKQIRGGNLQDFKVFFPDGSSAGSYGLEDKMSPAFAKECDKNFREHVDDGPYDEGGFDSRVQTVRNMMSTSEAVLPAQYAVNVNVTCNAWIYAREKMTTCYLLSALVMMILTMILCSSHSSLIEERFETERKRRFMADSMAHDMKTPISVIRSYAELLLGEDTSQKQKEYAETIIGETETMDDAVVSLLDLSKMEAGTYPMDLSDFALADVVRETIRRHEALLAKRHVQANIDIAEKLIVFADRKLIARAISNFLSNGIRNSTEGAAIVISAQRLDRTIRISVHNTGEALTEDEMKRLWDRYYQRRPGQEAGSGLGLAIVRNICLLHGGTYGCCNAEDGMTFWMQIGSQEDRIGKINLLTGPVTDVTTSESPAGGIGWIAAGTLLQGLFWSYYFFGKLWILLPCLFRADVETVTIILDPICLGAVGVGTGMILWGIRKLVGQGWQLRAHLVAVAVLLAVVLLTFIVSLASLHTPSEDWLTKLCLVLEGIVSLGIAGLLLSHYRIVAQVTGAAGSQRRIRLLRRRAILTTIITGIYILLSLSGMYIMLPSLLAGSDLQLLYVFVGSVWFLISLFSAVTWLTAGRRQA